MIPDPSNYRKILELLGRNRTLVMAIIIVSLLASFTEGLSVGLVITLLEDPQSDSSFLQKLPFLGDINRFFAAMTVVARVRMAALVLIFIVMIQSSLTYISRLSALRLQVCLERVLKQDTFQQLNRVALQFIHRQAAGDLIAILGTHTQQAATLVSTVVGAATNLSLLAVYTVLMLLISWQLTLAAAGLLIVLTIVSRIASAARLKKAGEAQRKYMHKLRRVMFESLSMMKLFHLYSQEKRMVTRFEDVLEDYLSHYYQGQMLIIRTTPLFNVSAILGMSLLLIAGTFLLPGQTEAWLGRTVLFLVIVFRLMGPVSSLNRAQAQVTNYFPSLEAINDFLARDDKPYLKNGKIAFQELKEGLRLNDITFHYEPSEPPVLKNVTFEVPKGEMTAVVGPSGAGKSTIINLVARLYDCDTGEITVDGTDLRDLEISSWRSRIAVVSQDTLLLNDSVMENLKFARQSATEADVFHAARLAQIDDFVASLPQGYDTTIGDRGVRLSGGQQQRLAIARALLANPDLLILDEATSALDSETERAIQTAIEAFGDGRTLLVIAHRLSTIRHADNIVVIQDGQVVEQGKHKELLQTDGLYSQLVQTQNLEHDIRA